LLLLLLLSKVELLSIMKMMNKEMMWVIKNAQYKQAKY